MSETLFDVPLFELDGPERATFSADWHYHGRPSGYRYGCRCERCTMAHAVGSAESKARAGSRRVCTRCGETYVHIMNSGTGTKFCASCKAAAYEATLQRNVPNLGVKRPCENCGTEVRERRNHRWHLCPTCWPARHFVNALMAHHADLGFVLRVLARPRCWACDTDLLVRVRDNKGRDRFRFALDHDHACCPNGRSCGACLRGLLCMDCNTALGYLRDSQERVQGLADYLAGSGVTVGVVP